MSRVRLKKCARCGKRKPSKTEFPLRPGGGRTYKYCHQCVAEMRAEGERLAALDGRVCNRCREWRPWDEFGRAAKNANGRMSVCKACRRAIKRGRYSCLEDDAREEAVDMRPANRTIGEYRCSVCGLDHPSHEEAMACCFAGVDAFTRILEAQGISRVEHDNRTRGHYNQRDRIEPRCEEVGV